MTWGIVGVFECDLQLSARILGTKLRRIGSKIARFCIGFGAIFALKTCASTAKRVPSSRALLAHLFDLVCTDFCNVRCVPREKTQKNVHEDRTRSRRFLQRFSAQHARCECAMHAEVFLDVLKMTWGIVGVFECDMWEMRKTDPSPKYRFRPSILTADLVFFSFFACFLHVFHGSHVNDKSQRTCQLQQFKAVKSC